MRNRLLLCSAISAAFSFNAALADTAQSASPTPTPIPFAFATTPGRLPKNVIPVDYAVSIKPNAATYKIAGTEVIELEFTEATDTIQFNSLNQTLSHVLLDGKPVKSTQSDDKAQLTTVMLNKPAGKGRHTLRFSYEGKIETGAHGLFKQEYVKPGGGTDFMLSTQFEATDARRMFPCWDEPAFRATVELTATVPAAWMTVSNMPATKREVHGDMATTTFGRTPKMPTYLVEFTAGDLAQVSAESGGYTFNVVAAKGQEQGGLAALANAQQILADYNSYFGMRFPLPKLDSIAIPGGFGGAMENWGAITYNDQLLLITPSSTMGNRQTVYSVQAHEMAHQWFGDLVTMGWWDELWLNESFASWRAAKQTDIRHPDWHWWEREDGSKENAMAADARISSHAILQHVTDELQAENAFDPSITYDKGQAVLRMLEAYLGPDTFRDGIRIYMRTHAYSNTTSADLWLALSKASGRDVTDIASSWTAQPGFPVVSVKTSCDVAGKRSVSLSQKRFLLQGEDTSHANWSIPLEVRIGTAGHAESVLLSHDGQVIDAGRCDEALSLNADAIGYYRVAYDDASLQANINHFATMPGSDRIALLDDEWALVSIGTEKLSNYLALVKAMGADQNLRAWTQISEALATIEQDERGTPGHDAFVTYARSLIKPLATQLGWDAKADESPGIQRLRRSVISDLGAWGDQEVIAEARKRFARFVADHSTATPDDQVMILTIIAKNAGDADFDQLHAIAKASKNETEIRRYYAVLMSVRDSALAKKAAEIALSDEIQKQADMLRLGFVIGLSNEHPELAWATFTQNLGQIMASHQNFRSFFLAQSVPGIFWNAVPPDQLEAWAQAQVPAEMAPNIARGMESARFKSAEKTLLVKSADEFIQSQKS